MAGNDDIIVVDKLSKSYAIGHQADGWSGGLRHEIEAAVRHPLKWIQRQRAVKEEFHALQEVSFAVKTGEVIGIIGRNGAGKSTLLKVLSRITEPTSGRIEINGRVASLLEVGTGFHGDLSGRENIFLNGAILGMSKVEIQRKFDEIVAFSEVEKFLDTPVKRYSSGMYMRLAFAVAAHLEPEILIVDEVLAVGDAAFQKKCLGKMQEVSRSQGRTVLFVSHNMSAVLQLTSRAVVLDRGRVRFFGPTEKAVELYAGSSGADSSVFFPANETPREKHGSQAARFISFRFDRATPIFSAGEDFTFFAKVRAQEDLPQLRFSLTVYSADGQPVGSCFGAERPGLSRGAETEVAITIPQPRLAPGRYYCGVAVGKGTNRTGQVDFDVVFNTLAFEVRADEGAAGTVAGWHRNWGSIVFPDLIYS